MKKFTILFLVLAVIALGITPALAAKGTGKGKTSQAVTSEQVTPEVVNPDNQVNNTTRWQAPRTNKAAVALSGLYSIGTAAPGGYVANFLTLHDAVAALNPPNGVSGPVTFEFTDATYSDSGSFIHGYPGMGASNPVIFQNKAGVTADLKFTGGQVNVGTFFRTCIGLDSVAYMTWQGNGVGRPLTLECDTAIATTANLERDVVIANRGSHHLLFKNMRMLGDRRGTNTAQQGTDILRFSNFSAAPPFLSANHDITVDNVNLQRGSVAIRINGNSGPLTPETNYEVKNCLIGDGSSTASTNNNNCVGVGVTLSDGLNINIHDNDFAGVKYGSASTPIAITCGFQNTNVSITGNKIHGMNEWAAAAVSVRAISLSTALETGRSTVSDYVVENNMVYDVTNDLGTGAVFGVICFGASGAGTKVTAINNTISLEGVCNATSHFTAGVAFYYNGLGNAGQHDTAIVKNNIFDCGLTLGNATSRATCVSKLFSAPTVYTEADHNIYWYHGNTRNAPSNVPYAFSAGAIAGSFEGMQTNGDKADGTGNILEAHSIDAKDPLFISPAIGAGCNVHINVTTLGANSPANNSASVEGIGADVDGDVRSGSTPDIGADEFSPNLASLDATPVAVVVPNSVGGFPAGKTGIIPVVTVKNNGSTATAIPVQLSIPGIAYTGSGTSSVLAPGATEDVSMSTPLPSSVAGTYPVTATTTLGGDGVATNDAYVTSTDCVPKFTPPYLGDMEAGAPGWSHAFVKKGAIEPNNPVDPWLLGVPGVKSVLTGVHSGTSAWYTGSGQIPEYTRAALYSPYFDLTGTSFPIVKFWHETDFEDAGFDGGAVQYTLDYGQTWTVLGDTVNAKNINWYSTLDPTFQQVISTNVAWDGVVGGAGSYVHAQHYEKSFGGQPQVRFRLIVGYDPGGGEGEGWNVDDFEINDAPSISGKVYNDADNSGTFNGGDDVFTGAKVYLTGAVTDSQLTNGSGDYSFTNLFEGNYNLATDVSFGTNVTPGGGGTYTGVAVVKNDDLTRDFGYYNPNSVSGTVYYDQNHDQTREGGEPGMSGIQIDATGASTVSTTTDGNGDYSLTLQVAGNYDINQGALPAGYMQNFPKAGGYNHTMTFGGSVAGDDFGNSAAATATSFRTAKYEDWALASDYKLKQKAEKRKDWQVVLKFQVVAPAAATGFTLNFSMAVTGDVTSGTSKTTVVGTGAAVKSIIVTTAVATGDTFQFDGIGSKGKKAKVKVVWATTPKATKADVLSFIANDPQLRMPNLNNVGEELYTQSAFPTGLLVGIPQGEKLGNSVIHAKWKDVAKSLSKFKTSLLHTESISCLDIFPANSKPISKQQKALPPDKVNNKLFAELLSVKLNVAASVLNKFTNGFGELTYLDKGNPDNPFNNQTVNDIIAKGDSMISCLPITSKDSIPTNQDLYDVLRAIDTSFAGAFDTVSFREKTVLTGVRPLKDVAYLFATPGAIPASIVPAGVHEVTPVAYKLDQNYPNPFNPTTTIQFSLPQAGFVTLTVYNMLGQEVATLLNNVQYEEGQDESIDFDATNLASGVYFYRLSVQGIDDDGAVTGQSFTQVKKMLLMK